MRRTRREAARNEKQSNQPLSVSVIVSLLSFPSDASFYFFPLVGFLFCFSAFSHWAGRCRGRDDREEEGKKGNCLQDHFLTSCNMESFTLSIFWPADLLSFICDGLSSSRRSSSPLGDEMFGSLADFQSSFVQKTKMNMKERSST